MACSSSSEISYNTDGSGNCKKLSIELVDRISDLPDRILCRILHFFSQNLLHKQAYCLGGGDIFGLLSLVLI